VQPTVFLLDQRVEGSGFFHCLPPVGDCFGGVDRIQTGCSFGGVAKGDDPPGMSRRDLGLVDQECTGRRITQVMVSTPGGQSFHPATLKHLSGLDHMGQFDNV
jgi:hypothetical protein